MKLAYIILCHKSPKQVWDLIQQLNAKDTDFFVHIDKKAEDFKLPTRENIYVLPEENRIDVQWASKSMVVATLSAIRYLFAVGKKYDYICLISGQDFPIKSNKEIEKYLTERNGSNFIEVLPSDDPRYKRYRKRNEILYPAWMLRRTTIVKIIKKLYIYLTGGNVRTFRVFQRKNTMGLPFAFGSQWWCLTHDCLEWIYKYIETHAEVLSFFDYALVADECLFQTVFMTSPFKDTRRDNLTFLEWESNQNNPRVLTVQDLDLLKSCRHLFARKFDVTVDGDIFELLKNTIQE